MPQFNSFKITNHLFYFFILENDISIIKVYMFLIGSFLLIKSIYSKINYSFIFSTEINIVMSFKYKRILINLLIILLFTIFTMMVPLLLLTLTIFSAIFVLFLYFEDIPQKVFKEDIIKAFILFLYNIKVLNYLHKFHSYIFSDSSNKIFNIILYDSNILHLCYVLLAHYYVYITVFSPVFLFWSYLYLFTFLLFIIYLGLISKFLINTVHIIITACYIRYPSLLLVDSIDPNDISSPSTSNTKTNNFNFVSEHNYYHLPLNFPRISS